MMIVKIRKLKSWLTGKKPCTFETKHGHDFVRVQPFVERSSGTPNRYRCSVCGLNVMYDQYRGGFCTL